MEQNSSSPFNLHPVLCFGCSILPSLLLFLSSVVALALFSHNKREKHTLEESMTLTMTASLPLLGPSLTRTTRPRSTKRRNTLKKRRTKPQGPQGINTRRWIHKEGGGSQSSAAQKEDEKHHHQHHQHHRLAACSHGGCGTWVESGEGWWERGGSCAVGLKRKKARSRKPVCVVPRRSAAAREMGENLPFEAQMRTR